MTIKDSAINALRIMKNNKSRTGLTLLGLVIGITAVIIVFSAGEGIRGLVMGQVDAFGTDTIQTEIRVPTNKTGSAGDSDSAMAMAGGMQVTTLTVEDMEAVLALVNVNSGYAAILGQEQASYGGENFQAFVLGTSPDYLAIDTATVVAEGRFFNEAEDKGASSVAVLGAGAKERLFGDEEALGKRIQVRNQRFTVIGVIEERGAVFFMNFDDYIYLPVRTLQKKVMGIDHITYMIHRLDEAERGEDTAEEIRWLLRDRHNITDPIKDDFLVTTMQEAIDMLNTITDALTFLLIGIVAISLLVGGVGIMNIMYVSVTERTMEIGLRKAVGASQGLIMRQFLVEAMIITLIGGIIGSILGTIISFGIAGLATALNFDWTFKIPLYAYAVAMIFSLGCGLAFGVSPAKAAAKLEPVEALRSE